jgi:hypothetical protein
MALDVPRPCQPKGNKKVRKTVPGSPTSGQTGFAHPVTSKHTSEDRCSTSADQIVSVRYFFPTLNSRTVPINGMKATMRKTGA